MRNTPAIVAVLLGLAVAVACTKREARSASVPEPTTTQRPPTPTAATPTAPTPAQAAPTAEPSADASAAQAAAPTPASNGRQPAANPPAERQRLIKAATACLTQPGPKGPTITIQVVAQKGDFAHLLAVPSSRNHETMIVFMKKDGGVWKCVDFGTYIPCEELEKAGFPETVRKGGCE